MLAAGAQATAVTSYPRPQLSVREVEGVDVPPARVVALAHDVERQLVGGGDAGAAALPQVEECVLVHLVGVDVVGQKDDLHVVVLAPEKADHPEEEAARDVLLELAHAARDVAHGDHHGGGAVLDVLAVGAVAQVLVLPVAHVRLPVAGVALHVLQQGAPLVDRGHGPDAADAGEAMGGRLQVVVALALQVGQAEVREDQVGQLVDRHLRLVHVGAGLVAGAAGGALAGIAAAAGQHVPHLGPARALAHLGLAQRVEAEAVLLQGADRDLDDRLAVRGDHGLVAHDLLEVVGDGLADPLLMSRLVHGALALKRPVAGGRAHKTGASSAPPAATPRGRALAA